MKPGRSKQKGSAFERHVCALLSAWVTHGARRDVFWRSAMSGGRATVARKRGKEVRQAGDITAVAPEGHLLTFNVYIECKHYADLQFDSFALTGKGVLSGFWKHTCIEARKRGRRPWLIARENNRPTLLITESDAMFLPANPVCRLSSSKGGRVKVWLFNDVLAHPPPQEFTL